jgi:alkylation response protein AidB-like acyl-CoA dehydrogenase
MTFLTQRGEGRGFRYAGQPVHILAGDSGRSAGFAAMEITIPGHFAGPVPHAHDEFDEAIYVLSGRLHGPSEIVFRDVRAPASNMLAAEGDGFMIAQARLGPGRVHHAMRAIGMAERALGLMVDRAKSRVAFGKHLSDEGVVRELIA